MASASWDKTIRLWTISDGKCHKVLTGHTSEVQSVQFNGTTLFSGSKYETLMCAYYAKVIVVDV